MAIEGQVDWAQLLRLPLDCRYAQDPDWSVTDETYLGVLCAYCGFQVQWGRN